MTPLRKLARLTDLLFAEWPRRAGFWLGEKVIGPYMAWPIVLLLCQIKPLRVRLVRWALKGGSRP